MLLIFISIKKCWKDSRKDAILKWLAWKYRVRNFVLFEDKIFAGFSYKSGFRAAETFLIFRQAAGDKHFSIGVFWSLRRDEFARTTRAFTSFYISRRRLDLSISAVRRKNSQRESMAGYSRGLVYVYWLLILFTIPHTHIYIYTGCFCSVE